MRLHSPRPRFIRSRRRVAYTIAEVMIAVGLTGGTIAAVLSGFSFAFTTLQGARENLRAIQVLQEKTETIRLYNWDQINTPGYIPATFTAAMNPTNQNSGIIYDGLMRIIPVPFTASYSTNMVQVEVELSWTSGKVLRHRKLTTFVSRYGLQNYVY
jgi:hypothetical protein